MTTQLPIEKNSYSHRLARAIPWLAAIAGSIVGAGSMTAACGSNGGKTSTSSASTSSGAGGAGGEGGGAFVCEPMKVITADSTTLDTLLPLAATAKCSPVGTACGSPDAGIYASYRKDFFYPYTQYPEAKIPDPVNGGRMHIVTTSAVTGTVTGLDVHGVDAETLLTTAGLDWYHIHPRKVVAGQPVWITFHSRDKLFDAGTDVAIALHTSSGDAAMGVFSTAIPKVPITYVTTNEARDELTIFVQNRDTTPHTMVKLLVNGVDVTAAACIPQKTLTPDEQATWTVPLCAPLAGGAAWTVAVQYADAATAVGAGRAITTHFPIEYWPRSTECAFPSSDPATQANWQDVRSKGFDTMYLQVNWSGCPAPISRSDFISTLGANDFYTLIETGEPKIYNDDPRVLGVMIADEPDKDHGDPLDPTTGPKALAKEAETFWDAEPRIATYVGGSRHRFSGEYNGVADIAGMDIYAAGCAPHITDFGFYPPLRSPYDYAVAVRENHQPLPMWIYGQAFNGSSNSANLNRQADPTEARVQAYEVIAAGAKGLMYFQLILEEAHINARNQSTWAELGKVNHEIRAIGEFLQAGDPMRNVKVLDGQDVIVEAIRSQRAIVIPVINIASCVAPSDADCVLNRDGHWQLRDNWVSISVPVPKDFEVQEAFEIIGGSVAPIKGMLNGRNVEMHGIGLGQNQPTRLFVLASDSSVKQKMLAAL